MNFLFSYNTSSIQITHKINGKERKLSERKLCKFLAKKEQKLYLLTGIDFLNYDKINKIYFFRF